PDLATANFGSGDGSLLVNLGGGAFAAAAPFAVGGRPAALVAGSLDGDRNLDLVSVSPSAGGVSVLRGLGNGTFAAPVPFVSGDRPFALTAADFNGDGRLDVATLDRFQPNAFDVILGKGDDTF